MPRRTIKATVKTDVQPMEQPPVTSDLITTENNQLSVFDYRNIVTKYGDNVANRLQSLEHEITGIMTNASIETGKRLLEAKQLIGHGDFIGWHTTIWGISNQRANDFMNIYKAFSISPESGDLFPKKLRPASTMATTILNSPEEKREELVEEFKQEKEAKGKDLTEAEIKKLAEKYLKEKEEEIERLKEDLKEAKKGELFFQEKLDKKIDDYNDLQDSFVQKMQEIKTYEETIANQNKQIKELDSQVLQLDQELTELNQFQGQVEIEKEELDKRIKAEANVIVQAELEKERKALLKKEADLKAKEDKISKELKETQSLKNQVEREKDNLYRLNAWIDLISEFNQEFTRYNDRLKTISSLLIKLPNLLELSEKDRKIADQRIYSQMSAFNQNLDDFGKYNIRIQNAIRELDTSVLSVGSIDVEVKS